MKSEHTLLTEALELEYISEYGETIKDALQAKLDTLNRYLESEEER